MNKHGILNNAGDIIASFVAPITIRSNVPVFLSDTLSLVRNTRRAATHRWEIDTNLEPLIESASELAAYLITSGFHTPLNIRMPQPYRDVASNQGPQGLTSVALAGATTVAVPGDIPLGCYIRFATHGKVYIVTSTELGSIQVFPPIRVAAPQATLMYFENDVHMSCFLDVGTVTGMSYIDGILMDVGTIKLVEAI